ncbi:MAG: proline iminopeptidase-family hydrolase [Rhodothermales bacterium]
MKRLFPLFLIALLAGCAKPAPDASLATYFDHTGRDDVLSGGVRMIPIETPVGDFKVWTKRVGNNPDMKVLILHGGPGATHELYEAFDSYLPGAGIEYYYYDQLGSAYSDQPSDTSLWVTERFVEEVEQVRKALGLDETNFYLYGHSWGGVLAIEYAIKYQQHLKGLIVSNMMSDIAAYNAYARDVLGPQLDPDVLAEIRALEARNAFDDPRYSELLVEHYYTQHVLRMPPAEWPDPVNRGFAHLNPEVYVIMQGPSEFGLRGRLLGWDRSEEIAFIRTPTLVIGAEHDTMDPAHMEWMAGQFANGQYLYCPNGSHMAMYDDQETYFEGLIRFIHAVNERGR